MLRLFAQIAMVALCAAALVCAAPIVAEAEPDFVAVESAGECVRAASQADLSARSTNSQSLLTIRNAAEVQDLGPLVIDPPIIDFGEVEPGSVLRCDVSVANLSESPVRLRRLWTSCSCTAGVVGQASFAPGESTTLSVKFRAPREPGVASQQVVSIAADQSSRKAHLVLIASTASVVQSTVRVLPRESPTDRTQIDLSLRSIDGEPFQVRKSSAGRILVHSETPQSDHMFRLELDQDEFGRIPRQLVVSLDHPSQPSVVVQLDDAADEPWRDGQSVVPPIALRSLEATPSSVSLGLIRIGDVRRDLFLIPNWPPGVAPEIRIDRSEVRADIECFREVEGGVQILVAFIGRSENTSFRSLLVFIGESAEAPIDVRGRIAPREFERGQ